MSEITYTDQPHRPQHVVAIVEHEGRRLGHVICRGATYRASRKTGTATDTRRISQGFRTARAAAEWIAKTAEVAR